VVRRFVTTHLPTCRCPGRCQRTVVVVQAALGHLLDVLRAEGRIPAPRVGMSPAIHDELERFTSARPKDVTFTFDGAPAAQHSIWLGNVSDDAIAVLGAGAEAEYLLAIAQQSPDKVLFEVSWENPSGERDAWSTEIKLF
jgi:hypothetical protein